MRPQQAGGDGAPGAPTFRQHAHLFRGRPGLEPEQQLGRLLQSEVARGPGVGVPQASQQIDVRAPGADAVHGGERGVGLVGAHVHERGEIELAFRQRFGDRLQGADLRRGQADARELGGACPQHGFGLERIECRNQPRPDRRGARGRELLRHHDRGETGKAALPPPQRRPSRLRQDRRKARVGLDQPRDRVVEIGLGVDEEGHDRREATTNAPATQPLF